MTYIDFETEDKKSLVYFKPSTLGDIAIKTDKSDFITASELTANEVEERLAKLNNDDSLWDIPAKGIRARYWTNPKKETGITFERYCGALTAKVVAVRIKDHPEYGKSLELVLRQPSGKEAIYSCPTKGQYGMGLLERLPNVDFEKPLRISVYAKQNGEFKNYFTTLEQDGIKLESFFKKYDADEKKWIMLNGHPDVNEKELKKWGKEYWKTRYYPESALFMLEYVEGNVIPKIEIEEVVGEESVVEPIEKEGDNW